MIRSTGIHTERVIGPMKRKPDSFYGGFPVEFLLRLVPIGALVWFLSAAIPLPLPAGSPGGCDRADQVNPYCFEVLSYNIKMLEFPKEKNNARAREMIPRIGNPGYDVILFQELYDHFPTGVIRKLLLKGPVTGFFLRRRGGLLNEYGYRDHVAKRGFLVISKWPIVNHKWHTFSSDNNPGGRIRGVVYTEIEKSDGPQQIHYHVFTTHLWWDKQWDDDGCRGFQRAQGVREDQLRETDDFIRRQNIPDGEPIIIAGDFNFGGPGDSRRQRCNREGFRTRGYPFFKNQILRAHDLYSGSSWQPPNERILDHAFYRNADFDRDSSFVKRLHYPTDIDWGKDELSDHKPLLAHFEFGGWDLDPIPDETPKWVQNWLGTYRGQNDGRDATLRITGGTDRHLTVELQDRQRNITFRAGVTLPEDGPHHVIRNLTLKRGCTSWSTEPCRTKQIGRLFLHTWDTDHISGYTTWRGNHYGVYFIRAPDITLPDPPDLPF